MYKSPIEILMTDIQHQIAEQQDEQIYKAVVSVGINVDKDELIRALQYDRNQYRKGYFDGVEEATPKWIPVTERLPEATGLYIITKYNVPNLAWYTGKDWRFASTASVVNDISHWMPLPEPPKEGVTDG